MRRLILFGLCVLFASTFALADAVMVATGQDPRQDNWLLDGWVEELSTGPWNEEMQLIQSQDIPWNGHIPCPQDYENETMGTTVQVAITNMTNRYFKDLYYVGDVHDGGSYETAFTNIDELVADVTPANGGLIDPGLAFKIDAVGLNKPLVFESMTQDQVFEPHGASFEI